MILYNKRVRFCTSAGMPVVSREVIDVRRHLKERHAGASTTLLIGAHFARNARITVLEICFNFTQSQMTDKVMKYKRSVGLLIEER